MLWTPTHPLNDVEHESSTGKSKFGPLAICEAVT